MKIAAEKMFYVNNGPVLDSASSLINSLENNSINEEAFNFHRERGDFNRWIEEVLDNPRLAKSLGRIKTRKSYLRKLKESY